MEGKASVEADRRAPDPSAPASAHLPSVAAATSMAEELTPRFWDEHWAARRAAKGADASGDGWLVLKQGSFFGESAMLDPPETNAGAPAAAPAVSHESGSQRSLLTRRSTRRATVTARKHVVALELKRSAVDKLIGPLVNSLRSRQARLEQLLPKVAVFAELPPSTVGALVEEMREAHYEDGAMILEEGDNPGDLGCFYLIERGRVRVAKLMRSADGSEGSSVDVATLGEGQFFGERAIITSEPRGASVYAVGSVLCLTLSKAKYHRLLGPLKALREATANRAEELKQLEEQHPRMEDLEMGRALVVRSFAVVRLAVHSKTGRVFALKQMSKAALVQQGIVQHAINERRVASMVRHPFAAAFLFTYQDAGSIYLAYEALMGGDLQALLQERGHFACEEARFHVAQLAEAVDYMHELGVVHRGIKPENCMLDGGGYLRVADFGFAKMVQQRQTHTFCGTAEFLAPEIVTCSGHGIAVDWWALGVLLYELLTGKTPFMADSPMAIYKNIVLRKLTFPDVDAQATSLIDGLLAVDTMHRLGGTRRGMACAKLHAFFDPVDWEALLNKAVPAPWTPQLQGDRDTSRFEHIDDRSLQHALNEAHALNESGVSSLDSFAEF